MQFYPEGYIIDTPRNRALTCGYLGLSEAMETGEILEGKAILCDGNHNLTVELCNGMKAFIPKSEGALGMDTGKTREIAVLTRVNKSVCFVITGFETIGGEVVPIGSRRRAQEKCKKMYIDNLKSGQIIDARVTHLENFGAFVDIGCGVASLIPIDSISVSRISHPSDRFRVGQKIKAVVKYIEGDRVFLSHKELLGTWEENAAAFNVGETVAGVIRSIESYGIFVELAPNLAGLAEPKENVFCSQQASVYVKSMIPQKMKVKLVIIDAFDGHYLPGMEYFFKGDSIDTWVYSPKNCEKVIQTIF